MANEDKKSVSSIERHFDGTPTIVDSTIEEGCIFENSLMAGYGTIIIDKEFVSDILEIIKETELPKNFIELLTYINNKVIDYFYSFNLNDKSREETYANSYIVDDEGMIIGTKLSSLKGKNVALCSEKSIAVFIILETLYKSGKLSRKPSMVLSTLMTENSPREPHAFILMDKDQDNYPTKHLLYDVENHTLIEAQNGNKNKEIGIYSLTDEQHNNIINGVECTPTSLFEVMRSELHDVGDKRIYGSIKLDKSLG